MSEINTTPLIDVMLVLMIMVVITIPIMNHKVPVPLPGEEGPQATQPAIGRLHLAASGQLSWDGAPIDRASLPGRLVSLQRQPDAQLNLSADADARFEDYDYLLADVKRAGITRLGLVGNEAFASAIDR
jgi:biopolymer transport protein ExbD